MHNLCKFTDKQQIKL